MAGQTSDLGYWEFQNPDIFKQDEPLSAGKTWRLINNVNHLRDSSTQYRINFMGNVISGSTGEDEMDFDGQPSYYVAYFPWQCTPDGVPHGMDIRIAYANGAVSPAYTTATAYIVPYHVSDLEPSIDQYLFKVTGTNVTGRTYAYNIDTYAFFTAANPAIRALFQSSKLTVNSFETGDETKPQTAEIYMLKLIVSMDPTGGGGVTAKLAGVQIKEFA